MRYCSLGHANADGMEFCTSCGQQLMAQAPPTQPAPPPVQPPAPPVQPTNPWGAPGPQIGGWQPPAYGSTAHSSSSKRWWIVGGIVAGVVVLLGGLLLLTRGSSGGGILPPTTETLTVTLDVYTDDFRGCNLGWGYADVPGSIVIVEVDGKVVGTSDLSRIGRESGISCTFSATVASVPTDGILYEISIGRRGTGTSTATELEQNNWTYSASLGL